MLRAAGQDESDEYSAVLLWSEYVALGTIIRKGVLIPRPIFAIVAQCIIWGLSCCTEDADLKEEKFLSFFTALSIDRRRARDLQSIVGS